jgi:hypothetical protein
MEVKFSLEGHKEMQRALVQLRGQDIDKALATGFRRAATPLPGYMARAATTYYTVKQRELKDRIRKPDVKPSPTGGAEITIKSSAQPMSARLFNPLKGVRWQDKAYASIKIFKGGSRIPRQGAFRNPSATKPKTMGLGTPFVRSSTKRMLNKNKAAINKVTGPSFHSLFVGGRYSKQILERVDDLASDKLHKAVVDALRAKSRGFLK